MKKNLKTLVTMGAIALSLTTVAPSAAPIITAYADEEVQDAAYWQRWAHDYEGANRNGVYDHDGICARIIVGRWEDDIREIEKGKVVDFGGYGYTYWGTFTRGDDGKIQILTIDIPKTWTNMGTGKEEDTNIDENEAKTDSIGQIEWHDNMYSHTYIPVIEYSPRKGMPGVWTAQYDKVQTGNNPLELYKQKDTLPLPEIVYKNSQGNNSNESGGSSSSGNSSQSHNNNSQLTGWVSTSDGWIYQINGNNTTGWVNANGTWYFMNNAGIMQTGWVNTNGKWYYMNSNGSMATGWVSVDNKWYFLNGAGDMATGWVLNNGKWYYLDGGGRMLSNTTVGSYKLDASGAWVQ